MADRRVICPVCGHANNGVDRCWACKQAIELDKDDYHDVVFVGVDDGYHSWYSSPTSIHERYRCKNYGIACGRCVHATSSNNFCHQGRIDVRRMRRQRLDGSVYYEYKGWVEEA